jgi:hypothetical protein
VVAALDRGLDMRGSTSPNLAHQLVDAEAVEPERGVVHRAAVEARWLTELRDHRASEALEVLRAAGAEPVGGRATGQDLQAGALIGPKEHGLEHREVERFERRIPAGRRLEAFIRPVHRFGGELVVERKHRVHAATPFREHVAPKGGRARAPSRAHR